jgi:glyoxylase-like metal-dependent hydrolase (beta-lactamase superfamily II)
MRRAALKVVPIAEVSTFDDGRDDRRARPAARGARPGHADGSCAILLEARRALITGDALATRNPLTGRVGRQIGRTA